jgi:hypothetical protein
VSVFAYSDSGGTSASRETGTPVSSERAASGFTFCIKMIMSPPSGFGFYGTLKAGLEDRRAWSSPLPPCLVDSAGNLNALSDLERDSPLGSWRAFFGELHRARASSSLPRCSGARCASTRVGSIRPPYLPRNRRSSSHPYDASPSNFAGAFVGSVSDAPPWKARGSSEVVADASARRASGTPAPPAHRSLALDHVALRGCSHVSLRVVLAGLADPPPAQALAASGPSATDVPRRNPGLR